MAEAADPAENKHGRDCAAATHHNTTCRSSFSISSCLGLAASSKIADAVAVTSTTPSLPPPGPGLSAFILAPPILQALQGCLPQLPGFLMALPWLPFPATVNGTNGSGQTDALEISVQETCTVDLPSRLIYIATGYSYRQNLVLSLVLRRRCGRSSRGPHLCDLTVISRSLYWQPRPGLETPNNGQALPCGL